MLTSCYPGLSSDRPRFEVFRPDDAAGRAAWFCVRTHQKHETVAAGSLRQDLGLEVFLPRIRYQRLTRLGPLWTTEALFQNYLFARFEFEACLRRVQHARAVRGVVHFGERWPTIPDELIEELRQAVGPAEVLQGLEDLEVGEPVHVANGPFRGLPAVVARAMPGSQRVALLLEFLGRQTTVEISRQQVLRQPLRSFPETLLRG